MTRGWWMLVILAGLLSPRLASSQQVASAESRSVVATYSVVFQSTWSQTTHPQGFPVNPHFSGLIGATHDAAVTFWDVAGLASAGMESMAETGSKSQLTSEVNDAISAGRAEFVLSGGGIPVSPGQVQMEFDVSSDYPLVTLVSMLAPSPDWFVGVTGLDLREGGAWVQRVEVPLLVHDAGTDSGDSYTSANDDTDPPALIAALTYPPFDLEQRVGSFLFERVNVVGVEGDQLPGPFDGVLVYPNPTEGSVLVEFDGEAGAEYAVAVHDVLGRAVESGFRFGGGSVGFDLSGRPRGLYIVSVSDGRRTVTVPVAVVR